MVTRLVYLNVMRGRKIPKIYIEPSPLNDAYLTANTLLKLSEMMARCTFKLLCERGKEFVTLPENQHLRSLSEDPVKWSQDHLRKASAEFEHFLKAGGPDLVAQWEETISLLQQTTPANGIWSALISQQQLPPSVMNDLGCFLLGLFSLMKKTAKVQHENMGSPQQTRPGFPFYSDGPGHGEPVNPSTYSSIRVLR